MSGLEATRLNKQSFINSSVKVNKVNINEAPTQEENTSSPQSSVNNVNTNLNSSNIEPTTLTFNTPKKAENINSEENKLNNYLNTIKNSSDTDEKRINNIINSILNQVSNYTNDDKNFMLHDLNFVLNTNSTNKNKVEALQEFFEETKEKSLISKELNLDLNTLNDLDAKTTIIDPNLVERAKNGNLSILDRNKIITAINYKLKSNDISEEFKVTLNNELEKLKSIENKLNVAQQRLIHQRFVLHDAILELRCNTETLKSKSPELAKLIERNLNMLENSSTESSMRLRMIQLCKLQEIFTSDIPPKQKIAKLSKLEKDYNNLLVNIQNTASSTNLSKEEREKRVSALINAYLDEGSSSSAGRRFLNNSDISAASSVIVTAISGGGGVRSRNSNAGFLASNNLTSTAGVNKSDGTSGENVSDTVTKGENIIETASITPEVKESIEIVISDAKKNPEKFESACNFWKENNSFESYINATINMFKAEDEVNRLNEELSQEINSIHEITNNIKNTSFNKEIVSLDNEINNLIENANVLQSQIPKVFVQDPDANIVSLLEKFRNIVVDLNDKINEIIEKKAIKNKIDSDFIKHAKENQDKEKHLDNNADDLRKMFKQLKEKIDNIRS